MEGGGEGGGGGSAVDIPSALIAMGFEAGNTLNKYSVGNVSKF